MTFFIFQIESENGLNYGIGQFTPNDLQKFLHTPFMQIPKTPVTLVDDIQTVCAKAFPTATFAVEFNDDGEILRRFVKAKLIETTDKTGRIRLFAEEFK